MVLSHDNVWPNFLKHDNDWIRPSVHPLRHAAISPANADWSMHLLLPYRPATSGGRKDVPLILQTLRIVVHFWSCRTSQIHIQPWIHGFGRFSWLILFGVRACFWRSIVAHKHLNADQTEDHYVSLGGNMHFRSSSDLHVQSQVHFQSKIKFLRVAVALNHESQSPTFRWKEFLLDEELCRSSAPSFQKRMP